jgi:hypothetical protein
MPPMEMVAGILGVPPVPVVPAGGPFRVETGEGERIIVEIELRALVALDSLCSALAYRQPGLDADDREQLLAWSAWARRQT